MPIKLDYYDSEIIPAGSLPATRGEVIDANRRMLVDEGLLSTVAYEAASIKKDEIVGSPISRESAKEMWDVEGVAIPDEGLLDNTTLEANVQRIENRKRQLQWMSTLAQSPGGIGLNAQLLAESLGANVAEFAALSAAATATGAAIGAARGAAGGQVGAVTGGIVGGGIGIMEGVQAYKAARAARLTGGVFDRAAFARQYSQQLRSATTLQRAKVGAIEGMFGAAVFEAGINPMARFNGLDYTMYDSLQNILTGAPVGAGFMVAPKIAGAAWRRAKRFGQKADRGEYADAYRAETGEPFDSSGDIRPDDAEILGDNAFDMGIDPDGINAPRDPYDNFPLREPMAVEMTEAQLARSAEAPFESQVEARAREIDGDAFAQYQQAKSQYELLVRGAETSRAEMIDAASAKVDAEFDPQIEALKKKHESASAMNRRKIERKIDDLQIRKAEEFSRLSSEAVSVSSDLGVAAQDLDVKMRDYLPRVQAARAKARESVVAERRSAAEAKAAKREARASEKIAELRDAKRRNPQKASYYDKKISDMLNARLAKEAAVAKRQAADPALSDEYAAMGVMPDMSVGEIAEIIRENRLIDGAFDDIVAANDDAVRLIAEATPENRATAQNLALAQVANNQPVDVEDVLRGDYDAAAKVRALDKRPEIPDKIEFTDADLRRAIDKATADSVQEIQDSLVFSRAQKEGRVYTKAEIEQAARTAFGKHTKRVMESGRISVVQSVDEAAAAIGMNIPNDAAGLVAPDGRVFLIADNVANDASVRGLILHELGVHVGMKSFVGDSAYQRILRQIERSDDPEIRMARERVPSDTPPELMAEEALGYLVENASTHGLVSKVIAAIKSWFIKNFGLDLQIDEYTARHLALGALRKQSKLGSAAPMDGSAVMYSRAGQAPGVAQMSVDIAAELRPYDEALVKAEQYPEILHEVVAEIRGRADDEIRRIASDMLNVKDFQNKADIMNAVIESLVEANKQALKPLRYQRDKMKRVADADDITAQDRIIAKQAAIMAVDKIKINKQLASMNLAARERIKNRVVEFDGADLHTEGFLSQITGSIFSRFGAQNNASASAAAFEERLTTRFIGQLKRDGVYDLFASDSLSQQVSEAYVQINRGTFDPKKFDPATEKIARAMISVADEMLAMQNSAGAFIKRRMDWVTQQTHDPDRILSVSKQDYLGKLSGYLDFEAMGINDTANFLNELYIELINSKGLVDPAQVIADYSRGKGMNVSEKASKARELIFKEGMWHKYNEEFGAGTLSESFMRSIKRASQNTALLEHFGVNPALNIEASIVDVADLLDSTGRHDAASKLRKSKDKILSALSVVDGTADIPGNITVAKVEQNINTLQSAAKLGGAFFASVGDLASYASNHRYEGRGGLIGGIANGLYAAVKSNKTPEAMEILERNYMSALHAVADVTHRFRSGQGVTKNIAAGGHIFHRANLTRWWTTKLQHGEVMAFANQIGKNAGVKYSELQKEFARLLEINGIDESIWGLMQKSVFQAKDGNFYFALDSLERLPDSEWEAYLVQNGRKPTQNLIVKQRQRVVNKVHGMIIERMRNAVMTEDARIQSIRARAGKPGTFSRVLVNQLMMFKTHPLMFMRRVVGREIYGRGYDSVGQFIRSGNVNDYANVASLVATTMMLGYVVLTLNDLRKGKSPRPLDRPATWFEAMRQGGALGIYGDFLLQNYERSSGANLAAMLAGPNVAAAGDIAEVISAAARGDKFAVQGVKSVLNNTPFANLFYVKPLLDYGVMFSLYEGLNPGYLRRMERNAVRDTQQEWLFRPSDNRLRY